MTSPENEGETLSLSRSASGSTQHGKTEISTASELLSFYSTSKAKLLFVIGFIAAAGNGLVYPALAYIFSDSFSSLSSNSMTRVRELAFTFLVVGAYAFVVGCIQNICFEMASKIATRNFRLEWFRALLRQDTAFHDVYDVSGFAATISPNAQKVQRGLGPKFGEGIQFLVTGLGGIAYSFWTSWRLSLVILAIMPFLVVTALMVVKLNQSQTTTATKSYTKAGSVAYHTISNIRTVLALNALPEMIMQYASATAEAYQSAVAPLVKVGLVNGSMLASFICLYIVLTLYGTSLITNDVRTSGCDPSDAMPGNESCDSTGADVFGAMLGIAFAAQGLSQVANFIEAFTAARSACYPAMQAIRRTTGSELGEERVISVQKPEDDEDQSVGSTKSTKKGKNFFQSSSHKNSSDIKNSDEEIANVTKALLPKYEIDSSSPKGRKLDIDGGAIKFENVCFAYPTRPNNPIFDGLNLDIPANSTVAIVGPSGGGKSTTNSLIERFYDPNSGIVSIDGVNVKELNVRHLREQIGLVSQEPQLFASSIKENIAYGCTSATTEQIEEAARLANAHDFISSFPQGYDTQVGDKGAQLSGGQKQRIAIARVLVKKPKILLLDEATSALDSESELVVQEAIDKLLVGAKRTTLIIAHRLTTIRKADKIAYISDGKIKEWGTHEELMSSEFGFYRSLVEKQYGKDSSETNSKSNSRNPSSANLVQLENEATLQKTALSNNLSGIYKGTDIEIKFDDVTFAYPTRPSKNVFENFSLEIMRGETFALVGPSGGGKSTTTSMIERFYDPNHGKIEFSGVDIRDLNVHWLRDQIGYVGQEPTLFNETIGKNIAYGFPGASQEAIEHAAKLSNAHEFIMSFPDGYETQVGERGTQLSGGQKQRIAIARAIVKNPRILILDEATSALDSNSEAVVQEALDDLMSSKDRTTIVIAHRLSTIRNVDRIAVISDGKVQEIGSHDDLMQKSNGHYRRLVETQQLGSSIDIGTLRALVAKNNGEDKGAAKKTDLDSEEDEVGKDSNVMRARLMAREDWKHILVGGIGAVIAGGIFPAWGVMFGLLINVLFTTLGACNEEELPYGFETCEDYWVHEANEMRDKSYVLSGYWAAIVFSCLLGNCLAFLGFGTASEKMNKRIRDMAFSSLCRQEVAFFDKHPVGSITSQLQDDAAKIHAFSGQPIRVFLINLSSVFTGIIVSFIYMWPFALIALATIPIMGFATAIEMKTMLGEDLGDGSEEGENSPSGIIVESLLNIRTVASLTLEDQKIKEYVKALDIKENESFWSSFKSGSARGFSILIQQWVNALQFWWGGWVLFNYPTAFGFQDFLISMFSLLFSLFAFGASSIGAVDKKEAQEAAKRIFYLIDRESLIDPMKSEGKKLE